MAVKKVLIVDDFPVAQRSLAKMMERRGISTDIANSAREAIEYLVSNRPDFIFMDYMMPGMDGLEAIRAIGSNPNTRGIPIALCTANENPDVLAQATSRGAVGCLTKPVSNSALDALLGIDSAPKVAPPPVEKDPMANVDIEAMMWRVANRSSETLKGEITEGSRKAARDALVEQKAAIGKWAAQSAESVTRPLVEKSLRDVSANARTSAEEAAREAIEKFGKQSESRARSLNRMTMLFAIIAIIVSVVLNFVEI